MKTNIHSKINRLKSFRGSSGQRGSVIVLIALCMTVIVLMAAMAVDIGMMTVAANNTQRACDAAALAGASQLSTSQAAATTRAKAVAALNNVTIADADVTFPSGRIRVQATTSAQAFFSTLISNAGLSTTRHATAENGQIGSLGGTAPLGITMDDYTTMNAGKATNTTKTLTLIRNQDTPFGNGDVVALSLDNSSNSKSPSEFKNDLMNGISQTISVGQHIADEGQLSLNASLNAQQSALKQGLNGRSSMYMTLAVVDAVGQTNGNSYHTIRGIVGVLITSYAGNGSSITVRVLKADEMSNLSLPTTGYTLLNASTLEAGVTPVSSNLVKLRLIDDL